MLNNNTVVESYDSSRLRSTNKKIVGTDIFVPKSKALPKPSHSSQSLAPLDEKTLNAISTLDYILPDTNVLMYPTFELFLRMNANALKARNIKLSLCASVMMELYNNSDPDKERTRQDALRAWNLITAPEFRHLFSTYPPCSAISHADYNLLDAARQLKYRHEKNVLILTRDKELTSSIYNACSTQSVAEVGGKVQVLYIDDETANLTHYHPLRLSHLSNDVILPEWHQYGKLPGYANYFIKAFSNRTAIMHSSSIREAFLNTDTQQFATNLEKLNALAQGQKIFVLSTALYAPEIREIVKNNQHLFSVLRACHSGLSEEDAIYQAILEGTKYPSTRRILLISNHSNVYDDIMRKYQTCCKPHSIWSCYVTPEGFLRKTDPAATTSSKQAA